MDRQMTVAVVAAAVSIAVGTFALSRALATDGPLAVPVPASTNAAPTTVAGEAGSAPTTVAPVGAPAPTAAVEPVVIDIANFSFEPPDVTVAVGTEVVWTNSDGEEHSVVSLDGTVLSPAMAGGDEYRFTFTQAGVFEYICGFHNSMSGTITVTG